MAIRVSCPGCSKTWRVPDEAAGKRIACKACGERIEVPDVVEDFEEVEDDVPEPRRPRRSNRGGSDRHVSSQAKTVWIVLGILGGSVVLLLLCCGGFGMLVNRQVDKVARDAQRMARDIQQRHPDAGNLANADASLVNLGSPAGRFPIERFPIPRFPETGTTRTLQPSGVTVRFVQFSSVPENQAGPGLRMALRVYLPPGEHQGKSLACVLVAPAGTNMLFGNDVDDDDYHAETLPYAAAGMAVVMYSLDGGIDREQVETQLRGGYLKFRAACAGMVNGRNAVEYVLARLPQVDPERIYSAGHSSAGTASLLLAMHEPRIRKCVAYAPVSDVEARVNEMLAEPLVQFLVPLGKDFARQSSPTTHLQHLACPVFLFHAQDDSNVPISESRLFAQRLQAAGKTVTLEEVPNGDHYDAMVNQGIPRAIRWLKQ